MDDTIALWQKVVRARRLARDTTDAKATAALLALAREYEARLAAMGATVTDTEAMYRSRDWETESDYLPIKRD